MTGKIGKRRDALSTQRVGGMAFPKDYNWTCNVCLRENRAFEETCGYCEHRERETLAL